MKAAAGLVEQVRNIKERSDMFCTAHWHLYERYTRRALWFDLAIMALSSWLVAMAFVEPRIGIKLAPFGLDSQLFVGLLSIATFIMTIFQFRTDYRGIADGHKRTFDLFAEAKRQAIQVIAEDVLDDETIRRVIGTYDLASNIGLMLPDGEFLALKARHAKKVAISRHLSAHPHASVLLTSARLWIKDNFGQHGPTPP